jgi:predicted enzyme related to lactoylglutathione lyase
MGDYDDFSMQLPLNNETVTGICHAKNINENMPVAWLPYFLVTSVDDSVSQILNLGGKLITEI